MSAIGRRAMVRALVLPLCIAGFSADASAQRRPARNLASSRAIAIRAELADVLLQSKKYDDAAREYRALLDLDSGNRAYRLGLARALTWGERFREAEPELITLLRQRPGDPIAEALLISARSGMEPGVGEAATWLGERAGSSVYRRILARALTREGRTTEALAHYDTLLFVNQEPGILVERAYVHLERRDYASAERDARASMARGLTPEAYVLLGDLHRWRGELGAARESYFRARLLRPDSPAVAAAFARLERDERPAAAFMPEINDPRGWQSTNTAASDNLGAQLTSFALRRGVRWRGIDASGDVKVIRLGDRAPALQRWGSGYGGGVALSREAARGRFYGRARARAGLVFHPQAELVPDASFAVAAWAGAWGAAGEIATGPAYPSLLTFESFLPLADAGQMREHSAFLSIAGPIGAADVAAKYETSSFSDDNFRSSLQGFARYPLAPRFALLYSGSTLSFANASPLYWAPTRYVAHTAGVEVALRRLQGMSVAVRAMPGFAWSTERSATTNLRETRSAVQLSGGVEASYRSRDWEIGSAASYGRGRAGQYERWDALLQARYLP